MKIEQGRQYKDNGNEDIVAVTKVLNGKIYTKENDVPYDYSMFMNWFEPYTPKVKDIVTPEGDKLVTNINDQKEENNTSVRAERAPVFSIITERPNTNMYKSDHPYSFNDIVNKIVSLHEAKNHDYGNSFHDTYVKFGLVSALTRLSDKMNRLTSLYQKKEAKINESIEDTLMDLASYAIMTIEELHKNK